MNVTLKKIITENKVFQPLFSPILKFRRTYLNKSSKCLDKLLSNVEEGSIIVSIGNIPGKYELDIRSHLLKSILITKKYEPVIVDLIKKNTNINKDAINIGANIGLYTNLLANYINPSKKVLSIEPTPNAFKYLKANIERNNNSEKIITYNGIATNTSGIFKINIIQGNEEYSSIGEIVHSAVDSLKQIKIDVKGDTIDNLVEKYKLEPGIIVIDVEGAEYQVLLGAINTLKKYKPIIISELDDVLLEKLNSSSTQVIKLLENIGYNVKDAQNNKRAIPFRGNIIAS